ncbi:thermonuclease family protein [Sandaracinobacteroides saxicola]|uniref:Thermonuclease family protein n=1 Tax=Sandaracinobacteroides saxicola TaxID=2759707 RepID=A0A7G5IIE7_9SPHN|nr:thermonuclease family protein [Sandaracinobacteroides saxicola]QMW23139.1 thermonuclease family protein [Sandaracinobacteroides saxicola]
MTVRTWFPAIGSLMLAWLLPQTAVAQTFDGVVVRVKDGDSLLVQRPLVGRVNEIRMAGIDAPELHQPWGPQAKSALRRLVQGRSVRVQVTDRDRYGRLVSRVYVGQTYVNAAMAAGGNAWAYSRYLPDAVIARAATRAKAQRLGLWSLPAPDRLPPPAWRENHPRRLD